jgi:HK97 family phage major capsid protein
MSLVQEVARVNASVETTKAATEFASLAKFILANKGIGNALVALDAKGTRFSPKLGDIVKAGSLGGISRENLKTKAAQTASGLSGSVFADYSVISQGFVSSLQSFSAFDGMLASCVPVPLGTGTVGAVSVGATGYSVSEGSAKPVSRLTITGTQQNPLKCHAIVVITQELAQAPGANALALIGRELRSAVAVTTDAQFLSVLISGLSAATSTGSTAEAVRADISNLLAAVTINQQSRLFILTTPLICKRWSMLTDQHGLSAFPLLTPTGGSINGITVLTSDSVSAGNVILADASGIAAASGDVALNEFREGTVQLESAPDSPTSASTNYISLWQLNLTAIMVERFIVAVRLRSDAVALCSNAASYSSGNSPP